MAAELGNLGLSAAAQRCRDARLPELLRAVRRRGERRRRRRALVALAGALLVLAAAALWWPSAPGSPPAAPTRSPFAPTGAANHAVVVAGSKTVMATFVRDDPAVVSRHAVATQSRAAWFVDDSELQALLRADGRTDGLVRFDGRVHVRASAIDPYDAP